MSGVGQSRKCSPATSAGSRWLRSGRGQAVQRPQSASPRVRAESALHLSQVQYGIASNFGDFTERGTSMLPACAIWEGAESAAVTIIAHVGPTKARATFECGLAPLCSNNRGRKAFFRGWAKCLNAPTVNYGAWRGVETSLIAILQDSRFPKVARSLQTNIVSKCDYS
jgi:hypothetical protein